MSLSKMIFVVMTVLIFIALWTINLWS